MHATGCLAALRPPVTAIGTPAPVVAAAVAWGLAPRRGAGARALLAPAVAALCAAVLRRRRVDGPMLGARGAAALVASAPRRVGLAARGGNDDLRPRSLGRQGTPEGKPRVVFVIGGPGSGKGTQCERIAQEFGYVHLSAGDLLRAERKVEGSPLGAVIEKAITSGGTVPSEVIAGLLEQAMRKAGWSQARFVIDGYPRSEGQLKGWEATLSTKVDFMFCLSLEVGREEMKRRLLGRAASSGRSDDNEETIEKRFVTFGEETGPLLAYFEAVGKLRKINGERALDSVWEEVKEALQADDAIATSKK